jgi:cytochrome b pre-mRNA-processing protein 3
MRVPQDVSHQEGSHAEPTMLWPFNHFRKPRLAPRGTIETIYGMIVTQAREPLFYQDLGVPDTVNGRFDLLLLHLWMVLRHLGGLPGEKELSQALFDHFCNDMDHNLRELAVGDLKVPKQMQKLGQAFYGRAAAYDMGLADNPEALAQAINRNVLDGGQIDNARRLAAYAEAALASLSQQSDSSQLGVSWKFPLPVAAGASA